MLDLNHPIPYLTINALLLEFKRDTYAWEYEDIVQNTMIANDFDNAISILQLFFFIFHPNISGVALKYWSSDVTLCFIIRYSVLYFF